MSTGSFDSSIEGRKEGRMEGKVKNTMQFQGLLFVCFVCCGFVLLFYIDLWLFIQENEKYFCWTKLLRTRE